MISAQASSVLTCLLTGPIAPDGGSLFFTVNVTPQPAANGTSSGEQGRRRPHWWQPAG
jgi:hypothetical protein